MNEKQILIRQHAGQMRVGEACKSAAGRVIDDGRGDIMRRRTQIRDLPTLKPPLSSCARR